MNNRFKNFYMNIASCTSSMSRAKRLQVGCIIVKNNNIISFSWNGTPAGWDNNCEDVVMHSDETVSLKTKPEVIHAERNAIDKLAGSHESSKNATMFITHAPCLECAKSIYTSGIKEVFYKEQYRSDNGIEFLKKCGVNIEKI
jgi:dCMP deaminase